MQKAAIFDLDGTLLSGKSTEIRFIEYLIKTREMRPVDIMRYAASFLRNMGCWEKMFYQNKSYLKGKSIERLNVLASDYFLPQMNNLVPQHMQDIIRSHKADGDMLILISGTLFFIFKIFFDAFGFDDGRGTGLVIDNGICSGRIEGIYPRGAGKVKILDEFVSKYDLNLTQSTLYANDFSDRFVMEKAGNPVAVNPDNKLLNYAGERDWRVWNNN